jgi:sugar (pentulose or hexulose) kinase
LRYGLDLLRHNGLQSRSICLIGGGSKSQVWRQMVADTMNTPVICNEAKPPPWARRFRRRGVHPWANH